MLTRAIAQRLVTDASGRRVEAVEIERDGQRTRVTADRFVVSCGAVNSAALLLRSASDRHPNGLANSSGMVGTRYMAHLATMMQGVGWRVNRDDFQKTLAINDFYLRGPDTHLSARPDSVARPDGRVDGQGRRRRMALQVHRDAAHPALGVRDVGVARDGLARDDRGSATSGEPRDARSRRSDRC